MNTIEIKSYSTEDTIAVSQKIASLLRSGDVITLDGDLGAGKTVFTQGLAKSLGVEDYVTSPTFTIMNIYNVVNVTNPNVDNEVYHFDVYRICSPEEMYEIGFDEYLYGDGVCIIEWSSLIEELIPESAIRIQILKDDTNLDERTIIIKGNNLPEEL